MREIKFRRPFYRDENTFSHFSYWGNIDYKFNSVLDFSAFISPSSCNFTPIIKPDEQFTGLRDQNEVEIFENDKICFSVFDYNGVDTQYTGVVEYQGSGFYINCGNDVGFDLDWTLAQDEGFDLDWTLAQDDTAEVIGNIHESKIKKGDL